MSEDKSEKYRHDLSSYERPNFPYRCGRVARWGKPCWQGPTAKGRGGGEVEWVLAVFLPQREQLIDKCVSCHSFGGPTKAAHSRTFPGRTDIPQSNCFGCHREHQGSDFDLTKVQDVKCGGCHKNSFTNFKYGHIPFAANYPFILPNTVRYNHVDHANKADDPRLAGKFKDRPVARCTTCHDLTTAAREVR